MSWTEDLATGLAQVLDNIGAGTWDPDGTTGNIITGPIPTSPDRAIGVVGYNLRPEPGLADVTQSVQLWLRGTAGQVRDTADLIFDNLHEATGLVVGGIHCPLITFRSEAPMGVDSRGLTELAVSYDVLAIRQTASRLD